MTYDSARRRVLLFGGFDGSSRYGDTWEWDGTSWTQRSTVGPSPRHGHALAYDSSRNRAVLFGGDDGNVLLSDTWEWDGASWSEIPAGTGTPVPRSLHAMAFDSVRGCVVLFGGDDGIVPIGDTWTWNGTTWSMMGAGGLSPTPREYHSMTWDSAHGHVVLFGGFDGTLRGDMWAWDGVSWTQNTATGPSARDACALAEACDRLILFGGFDTGLRGDTWEWNAATWTQSTVDGTGPTPRDLHAVAYDVARGELVLFGGFDSLFNGETWEREGAQLFISQQPATQIVAAGNAAVFSIIADGTGALSFRWQWNDLPLSDGNKISGATTSTLTISAVGPTNIGSYKCLVSNACGDVRSNAASLLVDICQASDSSGDCNGNGVLDSCEIAASPSLDANGNGVLDSCETETAPDPTPLSSLLSPCGQCGGGAASAPLALLYLAVVARRPRHS